MRRWAQHARSAAQGGPPPSQTAATGSGKVAELGGRRHRERKEREAGSGEAEGGGRPPLEEGEPSAEPHPQARAAAKAAAAERKASLSPPLPGLTARVPRQWARAAGPA